MAMVTQKEIAKYAKVSAGTVSNVISGSKPVREDSRKRVLDAIHALNYQPNLIARSLKTNRTNTLGMIVPDITVPFYAKIIRRVELTARKRGYFLIVVDSQHSHELEIELLSLLRQRTDGILLVTAGDYEWSAADIKQTSAGQPVVCLDRRPEGFEADAVCVDDIGAAEMGVTHLLNQGHTIIAIITGPLRLRNEQERIQGYKKALRKAKISLQKNLIWSAEFDDEDIAAACRKGMRQAAIKPTAIFSTNGVTALGALGAFHNMGLATPRDFAFVAIDEVMTMPNFSPTITSVVQPTEDIGRRATELLISQITQPVRHSGQTILRLPAAIIVGESSRGYV